MKRFSVYLAGAMIFALAFIAAQAPTHMAVSAANHKEYQQ